jgi:protein-L-isoaspartate(D-aspartate) O-methyltransferase
VIGSAQSRGLRRRLVAELEDRGLIRTPAVREAFLSVPRELFVAGFAPDIETVYRDEVILTKRNAQGTPLSSSSQPAIMALMLEQLGVEPGMSVLEVGAGTGYNAALLSVLVGPRGRVVSIDIDPELAAISRRSLRAGGYRVRVVAGDGRDGFARGAPYDRIVVTASADAVPPAWHEQLRAGGLLEVPLRVSPTGAHPIPLLGKTAAGFRSTSILVGGFMPIRAAGEDAAAALKHPMLMASDATGAADEPLRQLAGEALRTLSPAARRRLLSVALGPSRRRPLGLRANTLALALYLSLRVPRRSLVMSGPRQGIGVITHDGGSLAVIEPWFGRTHEWTGWCSVYGDGVAEALLVEQVREWDRRGRPTEHELEISVGFDAAGRSRIGTRYRPGPAR